MSKTNSNLGDEAILKMRIDRESGEIFAVDRVGKFCAGDRIWAKDGKVMIDRRSVSLLRLAWRLFNGVWPERHVKTIDKAIDPVESNLRLAGDPISRPELTQERLRSLLKYCPASGLFSWVESGPGRVSGTIAGCLSSQGYIVIRVDGVLYGAHRLAIFFIYGAWPEEDSDHKNSNRVDNRLDNLRCATRSENNQNKRWPERGKSKDAPLGVSWCSATESWRSQIVVDGTHREIGRFDDANAAHQAYLAKKRELHPFCTI